jgi:hypothetical protein
MAPLDDVKKPWMLITVTNWSTWYYAIEIEIEIFYSNTGKPAGVSGPPLRMPSGLI